MKKKQRLRTKLNGKFPGLWKKKRVRVMYKFISRPKRNRTLPAKSEKASNAGS